jgi:hypothetical protein
MKDGDDGSLREVAELVGVGARIDNPFKFRGLRGDGEVMGRPVKFVDGGTSSEGPVMGCRSPNVVPG